MRKGGWFRRTAWALGILLVLAAVLALTFRWWAPSALRLALAVRGVQVKNVKWPEPDRWVFEGLEAERNGVIFRAAKVTTLTPGAWKRALEIPATNETVFFKIDQWRLILPASNNASEPPLLFETLTKLEKSMALASRKCPRAYLLNGAAQTPSGEFRFGLVNWKEGDLEGDVAWPRLNDPAEFKLRRIEPGKIQFILKQYALDIGSRITANLEESEARVLGYIRWDESRADFNAAFGPANNTPRHAVLESEGFALPGQLIGVPEIEQLNASARLVITNGAFDLRIGEPASTSSGAEESR